MKKLVWYCPLLLVVITSYTLTGKLSLASSHLLQARFIAWHAVEVRAVSSGSRNDNMVIDGHGFIKRTFVDTQRRSLTYYLFVPRHDSSRKKYPLVLLLHGSEERANSKNTEAKNEQRIVGQTFVQVWGNGFALPDNPQVQRHWPSFIVVPQMTITQQWVNIPSPTRTYVQPTQPSQPLLAGKELLDSLQQEYRGIDSRRLYITGFSLGGYGTWDAIARWPHYFAAAVPIAGAGDPSKAKKLVILPIWAFHGGDDKSVPVAGSRIMIAAIRTAGGHPRYTEFAHASHSVWWRVFSATGTTEHVNGFYNWLFAQKRPPERRHVSRFAPPDIERNHNGRYSLINDHSSSVKSRPPITSSGRSSAWGDLLFVCQQLCCFRKVMI